MTKVALGMLLIILGVAFGLYAGIWWALIGGIVDVINEVQAEELSSLGVAIGVAKILLSPVIGKLCAALFILPGAAIATYE